MRLVNIHTLQLEEFFERNIPPYAILSHRWTAEELTCQSLLEGGFDERKQGYRKLVGACRAASNYNVDYLWIDTCCIDKKSSAELSEAINSMYKWYEKAEICLAHLADTRSGDDFETSFRNSVWFSRSWTLQELLAPPDVHFFDGVWCQIGSKKSQASVIAEVTGIPKLILTRQQDISDCPIAVRMSWAAHRIATREEDVAYSLMGIFDVNIPPLYGEGQKAFQRLLEEIVRRTTDNTFLLWGLSNRTHRLLARTPTDFDVVRGQSFPTWDGARPFNLTNFGLDIDGFDLLRLGPYTYGLMIAQVDGTNHIMVLRKHGWLENVLYRIGMHQMPAGSVRWFKTRKWTVLRGTKSQKLEGMNWAIPESFGFDISSDPTLPIVPIEFEYGVENLSSGMYECKAWDANEYPTPLRCEFSDGTRPAQARMLCQVHGCKILAIDLSFDFDSNPCALLYQDPYVRPTWRISDTNKDSLFYRKTHSGHAWRISDSVQDLDTTVVENEGHVWAECNMITSRDDETTTLSAFFRASSLQPTFARVPESLVPREFDSPLFVALIPPDVQGMPRREFWKFEVLKKIR